MYRNVDFIHYFVFWHQISLIRVSVSLSVILVKFITAYITEVVRSHNKNIPSVSQL